MDLAVRELEQEMIRGESGYPLTDDFKPTEAANFFWAGKRRILEEELQLEYSYAHDDPRMRDADLAFGCERYLLNCAKPNVLRLRRELQEIYDTAASPEALEKELVEYYAKQAVVERQQSTSEKGSPSSSAESWPAQEQSHD